MEPGQSLSYNYKAPFQKASVNFSCSPSGDHKVITCLAEVKIPVLKKSFETSTDCGREGWLTHKPICEKGSDSPCVENSAELQESGIMDPISFFMKIHETDWCEKEVKILLGKKVVTLEVEKNTEGYCITYKGKDQQLLVKKDSQGISSLEVPVPVIGNLVLKRV